MIQVNQRVFKHDPDNGQHGDCFLACLASLLEIELDQVPNLWKMYGTSGTSWFVGLNKWLGETYDLAYLEFQMVNRDVWRSFRDLNVDIGFHIISGPSPRLENVNHAVIGFNGLPYFDPMPDEHRHSDVMLLGDESDWFIGLLVKRGIMSTPRL